jgi:hypothetical protein
VNTPRRLLLTDLVAAATGFGIGKIATAPAAGASAVTTLRVGNKVTIPAVNQRCAVYMESGAPELYCGRPRRPRHQVTTFGDSIMIWKAGDPDHPAWSGKPIQPPPKGVWAYVPTQLVPLESLMPHEYRSPRGV